MPSLEKRPAGEHSPEAWSAPFGVCMGAPLRLHISLLLVVVGTSFYAVQTASFHVALALIVYLVSLLAHEAAHASASWRIGGGVDKLILGPVGGLRLPRLPNDPDARVFVAMAGPICNLAILALGACCLAMNNEQQLLMLFVPSFDSLALDATVVDNRPVMVLARIAVWINWPLFVLNLLPAFPFDGSEVARSLLWPWLGRRSATLLVARLGYIVGVSAIAVAIYFDAETLSQTTRFALLGVGLLMCFGAHRDLLHSIQTHDTTPGNRRDISAEGPGDPLDDFWLEESCNQMALVELKQRRVDATSEPEPNVNWDEPIDEDQLDKVLAKLYSEGIETLSSEERSLLDRASKTFRERRRRD